MKPLTVLSGAHGGESGNLIEDETLFEADKNYIEKTLENKIPKEKSEDIHKKNIIFDVINVFSHAEGGEVKSEKLCEAIRKFEPTTLVLGYCYSSLSKIRQMLDKEGIFCHLFLQEDIRMLTGRR